MESTSTKSKTMSPRTVEERFRDHDAVIAALSRGVRRALWRHKQLGQSIVIWKDDRIVRVPADEIDVDSSE